MFLHKLLLFHLGFFLLTRHAASILNLISAEKNLIGSYFFSFRQLLFYLLPVHSWRRDFLLRKTRAPLTTNARVQSTVSTAATDT